MEKKHCLGCYNNVYNNGLGGARKCWSFKDAKLILRKEVHIDQPPPWKQKARRFPDCYCNPRYVYISPDEEY